MNKPYVGQDINGWVVGKVWEWPQWYDCTMVNKTTGEYGYLRITK